MNFYNWRWTVPYPFGKTLDLWYILCIEINSRYVKVLIIKNKTLLLVGKKELLYDFGVGKNFFKTQKVQANKIDEFDFLKLTLSVHWKIHKESWKDKIKNGKSYLQHAKLTKF